MAKSKKYPGNQSKSEFEAEVQHAEIVQASKLSKAAKKQTNKAMTLTPKSPQAEVDAVVAQAIDDAKQLAKQARKKAKADAALAALNSAAEAKHAAKLAQEEKKLEQNAVKEIEHLCKILLKPRDRRLRALQKAVSAFNARYGYVKYDVFTGYPTIMPTAFTERTAKLSTKYTAFMLEGDEVCYSAAFVKKENKTAKPRKSKMVKDEAHPAA